jgi:hypothetical protein
MESSKSPNPPSPSEDEFTHGEFSDLQEPDFDPERGEKLDATLNRPEDHAQRERGRQALERRLARRRGLTS